MLPAFLIAALLSIPANKKGMHIVGKLSRVGREPQTVFPNEENEERYNKSQYKLRTTKYSLVDIY